MSDQSGFSILFITFGIPVLLIIFFLIHHSVSSSVTINNMKKEVEAMNIAAALLSTTCSSGDGVDSTPECTFTYQGSDARGIVASVEAAGYAPLSEQPINYNGNVPIILTKDKTSPHGINIFIHNSVELEIN